MLLSWKLALLLHIPLLVNATPVVLPSPVPSKAPLQGNLLEFDDTPPGETCDYKTCSERGNNYWNKLTDTLEDPNASDRTDTCAVFQESYTAENQGRKPADSDLWDAMRSQSIDPTRFDMWITSDKQKRADWEDRPYYNSFNTHDGVIIAEANFRNDDRAKIKLNWSELMYHTWHRAAAHDDQTAIYRGQDSNGGALSNLKTIVQKTIVNVQTMSILQTMYDANGLQRNFHIDWIRWTEDGQPAFWKALMGTDNVKGAVYLLNDHSQELGRKIVTEVFTRWQSDYPDIWINIGPYEATGLVPIPTLPVCQADVQ
ncbi:MAG: hypothetical protein Q9168_004774 [Polycauliona sp. 1 TL-2023]